MAIAALCVAWFHLQLSTNLWFLILGYCTLCKYKQPCGYSPQVISTGCGDIRYSVPSLGRSWWGKRPHFCIYDYETWSELWVIPMEKVGGLNMCWCVCLPYTIPLALPIILALRGCGWKLAETSAETGVPSLVDLKTNLGWIALTQAYLASPSPVPQWH